MTVIIMTSHNYNYDKNFCRGPFSQRMNKVCFYNSDLITTQIIHLLSWSRSKNWCFPFHPIYLSVLLVSGRSSKWDLCETWGLPVAWSYQVQQRGHQLPAWGLCASLCGGHRRGGGAEGACWYGWKEEASSRTVLPRWVSWNVCVLVEA